jgi:hypothetical protein
MRLKIPPVINQFITRTLDKNQAETLFKLLLKYRYAVLLVQATTWHSNIRIQLQAAIPTYVQLFFVLLLPQPLPGWRSGIVPAAGLAVPCGAQSSQGCMKHCTTCAAAKSCVGLHHGGPCCLN